MFLPIKKSKNWFMISGVFLIINTIAIFYSRMLLGLSLDTKNVIALTGISIVISLLPTTGYFGLRILPVMSMLGNILGIIYMYFIILGNRAQGWNDITSMIALLYFVALGTVLGILMEGISKLLGGKILPAMPSMKRPEKKKKSNL